MDNCEDIFKGAPVCLQPGFRSMFNLEDGAMGSLNHIDHHVKLALVDFKKRSVYLPLDRLLILRDPARIRIDAHCNYYHHTVQDYRDIMEVALFADAPQSQLKRLAVQLALLNPIVLAHTMQTLSDALRTQYSKHYQR